MIIDAQCEKCKKICPETGIGYRCECNNGVIRRVPFYEQGATAPEIIEWFCKRYDCDNEEFRGWVTKLNTLPNYEIVRVKDIRRKKDVFIALILYTALLITNQPCTKYNDFLRLCSRLVPTKTINRYYRQLKHDLDLKTMPCVRSCAVGICNSLHSESLKNSALEMIDVLEKTDLLHTHGSRPSIQAAGIVYLIGQETKNPITQDEIARVCGGTTVSVRHSARQFETILKSKKMRAYALRKSPLAINEEDTTGNDLISSKRWTVKNGKWRIEVR
jgi:hypothetical protein